MLFIYVFCLPQVDKWSGDVVRINKLYLKFLVYVYKIIEALQV